MKLYLSLGEFCSSLAIIQSSLPAQHVAIVSHTFPRLCHLHSCFHLVRFSGSSFIIFVCRDCHHIVLLHSYTFFRKSITAFVFSSHTHTMVRHILSAIYSYRKGSFICTHIFRAIIHVLVWYSTQASCFTMSAVHDQVSLPKEKTANTWSTKR